MPKVRVADIDIYYEMHGVGEPLVLIMGLGGGSSMWWRQVSFFSPEYHVIAYDSRGVGRTDNPDIPYSMGMLVGDAAGLLEKLGVASAHIYGVSMGGMVAQELALRYPKLVSSLILGATTCGGSHALMPSQETLQKLFGIMTLSPDEAVRVSTSVTFSVAFIERHPARINEWLIKGAESPPSPMGFKRQAEAMAGFDTYDRLKQIRVPTLIMAGTADQLIPAENSRILASRIPNAKLVLFEGAGHGYLWEAEEEANRAVRDFLRQHLKTPIPGQKGS
jgi:pimeloyl-ACP methyl ester carboxylesterase